MTPKKVPKIDLTNKRFGRLVALHYGYDAKWLCRCDCGNEKYIAGCTLRAGTTQSCGCMKKEVDCTRELTHGMAGTPEYRIYYGMRHRCNSENDKDYRLYGGKGIKVCDRWMESFENFLADMGKRPTSKHSLDRWPNNKGNYQPNNCRWATNDKQQKNRSNIVWIDINGEKISLVDAEKRFNIHKSTMWGRLKRGKNIFNA